jgi:hypothetical protein
MNKEEVNVLDVGNENEPTFVCFSCMRPNEFGRQYCKFCNAPISQTSSSDPLQIAYGEGMAYRKAAEGKPKFVVVLGVWIIFFPTLIVSAVSAFDIMTYGEGTSGFLLFWVTFLLAVFCSVMVYRVTKNYIFLDKISHEETAENIDID